MTAPTKAAPKAPQVLDLASLAANIEDDAPEITITRKRKSRELSPLGAAIKASFESGKAKRIGNLPSEVHAKDLVRELEADAKILGLGVAKHIDAPKSQYNQSDKWAVRFQGKKRRQYNRTVTS